MEDSMVLSRHNLIPVVLSSEKRNLFEYDSPSHKLFDVEFVAEKLFHFLDRTLC